MVASPLKTELQACADGLYQTDFSIGHRGAPMQFSEHTRESYVAAARMGGHNECDVTFTRDQELVCRRPMRSPYHHQYPCQTRLAAKCTQPFTPADPQNGVTASALCCTSDITLAEFKTLQGKMDAANPNATTVEACMNGTARWRTDLYASRGTLMTHQDSIELFVT